MTLAPTGVDLRFTSSYSLRSSKTSLIFTLRNGQDDKFAKNVNIGSTAILLPNYLYLYVNNLLVLKILFAKIGAYVNYFAAVLELLCLGTHVAALEADDAVGQGVELFV